MSEHISIIPVEQLGEDERGSTHHYRLNNRSDFVLITRKAGTMSGNTYHEGKSLGTNPKTFVFLTGVCEFSYRHIAEKCHQVITVDKPTIIEVLPQVTHAVKAISDITMLECNSIAEIEKDRHRETVELPA